MENKNEIEKRLLDEIEELRVKLRESGETLSAIRGGEVDAIVVSSLQGEQVFTLTGAEQAYRVLIETMNEGAASINGDGVIIYCNQRLSEMLKTPLEKVIGAHIRPFIRYSDRMVFDSLVEKGARENDKGEVALINNDGTVLPVLLSISAVQKDNANIYGITVTDLTAQKQVEDELKRHRDNLEELVKDRTNELETSNQQLQGEITERKQAEKDLHAALVTAHYEKNRAETIIASMGEGLSIHDMDFIITYENKIQKDLIGDHVGEHCYKAYENKDHVCGECPVEAAYKDGGIHKSERSVTTDKGIRCVEITASPLRDMQGNIVAGIEVIRDVSRQKKLEAQLLHSQKMEGIGTLAGGIAHDFNNMLSAIVGYGHITLMKMQQGDPLRVNIEHMLEAADRAAVLTKSLLAFSRKQVLDRQPIDLNKILTQVEKFLVRVIGEDVAIRMTLDTRALIIDADAGQLEQVFMNLATNARDAMPKGGSLIIESSIIEVDNSFVSAHGDGKPGTYAVLSVSDTGMGMNEETRNKIFEPFFTTKEVGKGTGLGLAMVYGIIKQHDGFINVYSEPGKGTSFKIYLPLLKAAAAEEHQFVAPEDLKGGTETILFAEDDANLRKLNVMVLEQMGYTVITAIDGEEAVTKFLENKDKIQMLLFDIIMPKKSGREACEEIRKTAPGIPVLFASGYSPDMLLEKELLEEGMEIAYKPMSPMNLLKKVREILDRKR